jgi:site-specific DNA-methyltransferase (adenine-specific)
MGKYSVCDVFDDDSGNIMYDRIEHVWEDGKCAFCGANQENYDRGEELETYAYQFIHKENPEELFNMKFDVIVGNPPYQLSTAGSVESQATPIYNKFVETAIKLNPRYLTMIIPARWFSGGFGLDKFRNTMLNDTRLRIIHDYFNSNDCFPGIDLSGGVCYFLWDRDNPGNCKITTNFNGKSSTLDRPLLEKDISTFIRFNEAVSIITKIASKKEKSFSDIVSPRDPFGLNYYENGKEIMFKKFSQKPIKNGVRIYYYGWQKDGISYVDAKYITTRQDLLKKFKIYISKAYGERGDFPYLVIGKPFIGEPDTCCNMTYLTIGDFKSRKIAENVISYMQTRVFRFLVLLLKNTQNAYRQVYQFVPLQDFSELWTDEKLYAKYGLTDEEIAFIESMVRPMEVENGTD